MQTLRNISLDDFRLRQKILRNVGCRKLDDYCSLNSHKLKVFLVCA